ncbi:type III secretion system HrpP C-terminal domain-containing protein [Brenneria uluponensis]|uniref:type III secretion system HrpP C-terminal domain-containing protein n=1 Tax=Brenneria uluponensis TaxID=3057057 RepID=UPI0028EF845A|nr:type III secretion system HrpP C-terminal domain-containing protein [Brenneria ulupoensis]
MNHRLSSSNEAPPGRMPPPRQPDKSSPANKNHADMAFWEPLTSPPSFEQLIAQPALLVTENLPVSSMDTEGNGAADATHSVTSSLWQSLETELTSSLRNLPGEPLAFSLQLPQLGDIDVRMASLRPNGWDVSLRFNKDTYEQLKTRRESCRRSLSEALACPIHLQFETQGDGI